MALDFSGVVDIAATLTADYLRSHYLFGISLVDDNGNPYADSFYEEKIMAAVQEIERYCEIAITPKTVLDEAHDYFINDYQFFAFIPLFKAPVLSVERVQMIFPTSQNGILFPLEWVKLDKAHGQVQLIPTAGTLSNFIIGQGGAYLPMLYSNGLSYLPQLFHIDYTAGFASGSVPRTLVDVICKKTCVDLLAVIGDVVYQPGITSKSVGIDGVSESVGIMNNGRKAPVFTGRIQQYTNELYGPQEIGGGLLDKIKTYYHGINVASM